MKAAVLLIAVLALVACSTTATRSYWQLGRDEGALRTGMSADSVEKALGEADRVESVGEGRKTWTYFYDDPSTPTLQADLTITFEDRIVLGWQTRQGE